MEQTQNCIHHWIIETNEAIQLSKDEIKNKLLFGRNSICKKCGENKVLKERHSISWED